MNLPDKIPLNTPPGSLVKWIRLDGRTGIGIFLSLNSTDPLRPRKINILTPQGIITEKLNMYFKVEVIQ